MRAEARCATQRATVLVGIGPRREGTTGERTLAQACIYGVAEARWSILAGALVRLGRLLIP